MFNITEILINKNDFIDKRKYFILHRYCSTAILSLTIEHAQHYIDIAQQPILTFTTDF